MPTHHAVPSLMFMTLGIGLVIILVALIWFLRHRSNRHPMDDQADRNVGQEIDQGTRGPPPGPGL